MADVVNPKMYSALCATLMLMVFWNGSVKPVPIESANRYVYRGKIYTVNDPEVNFFDAQATCERDGGMLAQITKRTVTVNFSSPLSQFLRLHIRVSCAWIGARDFSGSGWWTWTDGTSAYPVPWTIPPDDIFHYQRYTLNCGRLCQGDRKWMWEPVSCDMYLKSICEYVDPAAEHCVTGCTTPTTPRSLSAVSGPVVHKGKLFEIHDIETDFDNAATFCERDGGRLAIIKPQPGTMILYEPISRLLSSRAGGSCVYIGASDRVDEGVWTWIDGTRVYSIGWMSNRHLEAILSFILDCASLCPDAGMGWVYKKRRCDDSLKFVCEYDGPEVEPTVAPAPKPVMHPDSEGFIETEKKESDVTHGYPKPSRKVATVIQIPEPKLVTGEPLITESDSTLTLCSRLCLKKQPCDLINVNMATQECRGYSRDSAITYEGNSKWRVWIVEII